MDFSFQSTGLPRFPRGRVYRIFTVSTMIPIPLRIAYHGLEVKPKQKTNISAVFGFNSILMDAWIKKFS